MIYENVILEKFVAIFVDSGAIMLILCGLMAFLWFGYEGVRRGFIKPKNEEWERDKVSRTLKVIIGLGIILGIVVIITAILTMVLDMPPSFAYRDNPDPYANDHFDWLTSILLLVMGVAMFLKPLEDIPLATVIGLVAGAGASLFVALILPADFIAAANGYVNMKWVLFGIFVIVATLVGVSLKFWISGVEMVSKIISWPPFALVIGAFCIVQGFMLWIGGTTLILFGG